MQAYLFIVLFFTAGIVLNRMFAGTLIYQNNRQRIIQLCNLWIIRLALPALILRYVPALELTPLAIIPTLVAWGWLLLSVLLVLALANVFQWRRDIVGVMLLLVSLGNTSFIGYPMILAWFNEEVLGYAIFLDQFGSFVALSTFATVVLAIYSNDPADSNDLADNNGGPTGHLNKLNLLKVILLKIITFPPFLALIAALVLPLDALTQSVRPLLDLLGSSLMPIALLVVGAQFQPRLVAEQLVPLGVAMALKMLLAPALAWLVVDSLGTPKELLQASVFEMAMPAMMTPGIMAMQANLAPRFCASLLGYSTLLSMLTLPIIAFLLQ